MSRRIMIPNYTISNYKVVAVTPNGTRWRRPPQPRADARTNRQLPFDSLVNPKIKTTPLVYNYVASADVTLPALGPRQGRSSRKSDAYFKNSKCRHGILPSFMLDPLEIHPGPDFTVTGWVHTNSDLYTGHDTLTFADKVTYGSDWFTNFMTPAANPRTWVDNFGVTQYAVPHPATHRIPKPQPAQTTQVICPRRAIKLCNHLAWTRVRYSTLLT